jgi:hypothetical protein
MARLRIGILALFAAIGWLLNGGADHASASPIQPSVAFAPDNSVVMIACFPPVGCAAKAPKTGKGVQSSSSRNPKK